MRIGRLATWRASRAFSVLAASTAAWSALGGSASAGTSFDQAHVVFRIDAARITESSSLVVSTAHPGLVYTANDSGDGPYVYVLDGEGRLVGTTTLGGVDPVDVEAMSGGSDGSLVVADVGDNDEIRDSIAAYRIPQPSAGDRIVTPARLTMTYEDGPHNAESAVYDARSGRLIVITKELLGHVYTTGPDAFAHRTAVLHEVAAAPVIATDAALLPGGRAVVVRTYGAATVYRYPTWESVATFALPVQRQGESIAGVPERPVVWVGSEGTDSPVWSVPLPREAVRLLRAPSDPAPTTPGTSTPADAPAPTLPADVSPAGASPSDDDDTSPWSVRSVSLSAGVLVVVAGAAVWLSRRRRGR